MYPNNIQITGMPTSIATSVTVAKLRVHLGLFSDTSQDAYLAVLIRAAEGAASNYIGYDIGETLKIAYWPSFFPVFSIPDKYIIGTPTLAYVNTSGASVVVSSSLYTYDTTGPTPVIRLKSGSSYPTDVTTDIGNPVAISYTSGFESEDLSAALEQSIMMYCKEAYTNRGITSDKPVNKLPLSAERLLSGYKKVVV